MLIRTETDRYAWTKADYNDSEWKSEAGKFGAKKGKLEDLSPACSLRRPV